MAKATTEKKRASTALFANLRIGSEKDYFLDDFSVLLASGMDILSAIRAVKSDIRSGLFRKVIEGVQNRLESGVPLWQALEEDHFLPQHVISLIRVGEGTGQLAKNMSVIAAQEEKSREYRSKVRSAMIYPALVMTVTIVVGVGIAWFILPMLAQTFARMNMKLPLMTRTIIGAGKFLTAYGLIAVPSAFAFIASAFYVVFFHPRTKKAGQKILLVTPGIKKLVREVELARFGYIIGTMLNAGLPINVALRSLPSVTPFAAYRDLYSHLTDDIEEGQSFQKSMATYPGIAKLIPASVQQIIVAAEQSGHLPESFLTIGARYEGKIDSSAKNLTTLLEPVLLFCVWCGVMFIALGIIQPIYGLIGGLNNEPGASPSPKTVSARTLKAAAGAPLSAKTEPSAKATPYAVPSPTPEPTMTPQVVTQTPVPPSKTGKVRVLADVGAYLNVRDMPSKTGKVVEVVFPEQEYPFTDFKSGWYQIVLPGDKTGWITGEYAREVK